VEINSRRLALPLLPENILVALPSHSNSYSIPPLFSTAFDPAQRAAASAFTNIAS
jgi:hypothetical protein